MDAGAITRFPTLKQPYAHETPVIYDRGARSRMERRSAEPHGDLHRGEPPARARENLLGLSARRLRPQRTPLPRTLPAARRQRMPHRLARTGQRAADPRRGDRRRTRRADGRGDARRLG